MGKHETVQDIQKIFADLKCGTEGLTSPEIRLRLDKYGQNALKAESVSSLQKLLSYFWGPIPWMIEAAALLSLIVQDWVDFSIILVLLIFNAGIGFWEEAKASNALDALKNQMALKARVLRDGKWNEVDASNLVPGDLVRIRLGDVIPADVVLTEGAYLSVDQSALTGESLPVNKKSGNEAFSGSVAKQGEMEAVVTATGPNTFFGRTAKLVESAGTASHFQKAVMKVGDFLIFIAIGLAMILVVTELLRGEPLIKLIQFVLILVVASIPVAMPAVLSVTMALGALSLSKKKAIVSKLQAIEEMAGIDILCSDKTGTLTKNQLNLGEPIVFSAPDKDNLILMAGLASKAENGDAIDLAVLKGITDKSALSEYEQTSFSPFDPIHKRTEGTITKGEDKFIVTKGAPQVVLDLANITGTEREKADSSINEFASKGFRALGVAKSYDGKQWEFLGILSLFDPPRDDSKITIIQAGEHGIQVKMVTGDDTAIGRETAGQLGMGTNMFPVSDLIGEDADPSHLTDRQAEMIENADGFARVFPEHKYAIVKALQERGHIVAMTGDGVNDAPALKQADAGIAVSGATDAARAAADLILTEPGLSVIIKAVEEARRIFERMMSYTIYRIAMTIDIMAFVVLAMLVFDFYPLTAVMIIMLALLDDIPIMTIAYDNTWLDPKPVRWQMGRVLSISSLLGFLAVIETFGMLWIGRDILHYPVEQLQTMLFLQLVAGGHLMLFVTRTKKAFWRSPHPAPKLFWAITGTQLFAAVICGMGWLVPAIPWMHILWVWLYNLIWMVVQDVFKLAAYRVMDGKSIHAQTFLRVANEPIFSRFTRHKK
ncbi:MAG: plasma-membrane proton-efflux P-type ATPase [Desulfovibrio sp. S3730MH75]|nr:MAG: plasma-membrane proton-efflux P-type ATPase [Desulfovibrio sp. S3730MH75]